MSIDVKYDRGQHVVFFNGTKVVPAEVCLVTKIVSPGSAAQEVYYLIYSDAERIEVKEELIYSSVQEAKKQLFGNYD